jgi:hypothetical protein
MTDSRQEEFSMAMQAGDGALNLIASPAVNQTVRFSPASIVATKHAQLITIPGMKAKIALNTSFEQIRVRER